MKRFLAPVMLALFAFAPIAEEWQTITLMEKVTVSLPGKATEDKSKGMPMQKVVLEDKSEFNAFAMDYAQFGLSEEMLTAMAGTDQFKEQMEAGVSMQPGIKLISNTAGKYNDKYASYDMVLDLDKDGYKGKVNQRTVFYKSYGITVMYKPGEKGPDNAMMEKVFNSIKIAE
jgi:hypothetical protein